MFVFIDLEEFFTLYMEQSHFKAVVGKQNPFIWILFKSFIYKYKYYLFIFILCYLNILYINMNIVYKYI